MPTFGLLNLERLKAMRAEMIPAIEAAYREVSE